MGVLMGVVLVPMGSGGRISCRLLSAICCGSDKLNLPSFLRHPHSFLVSFSQPLFVRLGQHQCPLPFMFEIGSLSLPSHYLSPYKGSSLFFFPTFPLSPYAFLPLRLWCKYPLHLPPLPHSPSFSPIIHIFHIYEDKGTPQRPYSSKTPPVLVNLSRSFMRVIIFSKSLLGWRSATGYCCLG